MIKVSAQPGGARLKSVVFVARDRATGRVHATYTHSYFESAETEDHEAALDRWASELRDRLGPGVDLHVTAHTAADLVADWAAQLHEPLEVGDHAHPGAASIDRP